MRMEGKESDLTERRGGRGKSLLVVA